ncbi:MAG: ribosomal-protein-alanine N-acetyltransferase, partial [Gallionellales bacterium CG_4_9_14_0_8_um_filter_55_61]
MRAMTIADVEAVLALEQSVQPYPWTRGNFCDALASGYLCYVDEQAGLLRGYAVWMPGVDEAELLNIAVAGAEQRKGVGRRLLAAMRELGAARDWARVFLEVRAGNTPAI